MSGENDARPSSWTVDTLKAYTEQRFTDQDKAVQAALQAAKEAVNKAETATEKRFEAANEFRAQLSDQTASFLPRAEYNAQHKALEDRVTALTDRLNTREGQSQGSELTIGKIATVVGIAVGILTIIVLIANGVFK